MLTLILEVGSTFKNPLQLYSLLFSVHVFCLFITAIDLHSKTDNVEQHAMGVDGSDMMIAAIQKRHQSELEALQKKISEYETACNDLKRQNASKSEKLQTEAESHQSELEAVNKEVKIFQQKCKLVSQ